MTPVLRSGMRLLLDITRTLLRRQNATPSGIDRVEFAFLSRLLEGRSYPDVHFVVSSHLGCGVVPTAFVRDVFEELSSRWAPQAAIGASATSDALRACLEAPLDLSRQHVAQYGHMRPDAWTALAHARQVPRALQGRWQLHQLALQAKTVPTFYVHASHVCLEHAIIFRWTKQGAVKPIFFLHDLIPIDYPEFCGNDAARTHKRRLETVASLGRAIIVNSHYTKDRVERFLVENGLRSLPVVVSWLGTEISTGRRLRRIDAAVPYFVHVGTIEARKNIYHLLNVWRRMLATDGPERTPRLVLAGRRGWKSQNVFDVLDRGRELATHVIEASDLNDADLAMLVEGAAGVLAPSLVEGYGLPGAEALCRGIPVVASDIAAHREILGEAAILIDPTNGPGWAEAILMLARSTTFREKRIEATRRFAPVPWDSHVDLALARAIGEIAGKSPGPVGQPELAL